MNLLKREEYWIPRGKQQCSDHARDRTEMPSVGLPKNELSLKADPYSRHYFAIRVTERMTLREPPCLPLPVLSRNLSSRLRFELHFWRRVRNLKNCYKAKFITIIITSPTLTDGQPRWRERYLPKVTQELRGRTLVGTQVSRAPTKCFNRKAILFPSASPAGTLLAQCSR